MIQMAKRSRKKRIYVDFEKMANIPNSLIIAIIHLSHEVNFPDCIFCRKKRVKANKYPKRTAVIKLSANKPHPNCCKNQLLL